MSTLVIIVAIVFLLGALVIYAFAVQTIQQKKEKRNRLVAALKARSRNFKFMLSGFPAGFLTKDLVLLVQRSLADTAEQLAKLEPQNPSHMQDLQAVTQQMGESKRQSSNSPPSSLESHQQIKDVKAGLEELYHFVERLERKQTMPQSQAENYRTQIKQLALAVSVDAYCLNAKQASHNGKTKLALHHYELALKMLQREKKAGITDSRKQSIIANIEELQEKLKEEESEQMQNIDEQGEQADMSDEWDKYSNKEDMWKKKNIYD